ncbi:MAG: HEPN domain-containing protein [Bacteroidales bacterium]|nr:HEPN domain-containing protein [Bacteroidales bacterium]
MENYHEALCSKELIDFRLRKATDSIKEAALLAGAEFYSTAINRLYYAVYYAVSALLISEPLQADYHTKLKNLFYLKFIEPERVERNFWKIYQTLYLHNNSLDYEDFIYYDAEYYDDLYPQAIKFIDRISGLLNETTI